jgi:hypothetical protein
VEEDRSGAHKTEKIVHVFQPTVTTCKCNCSLL